MAERGRHLRRRWSGRPPRSAPVRGASEVEGGLFAALPWLFAVVALIGSLLTAVSLPPFQGPDELAHIYRADLLNHGRLVGYRVPIEGRAFAGGPTDRPVNQAERNFRDIPGDPQAQVDAEDLARAMTWRWGEPGVDRGYPNTAVYSPLLYLPQTAALALGKARAEPVLDSLRNARIANALTCIAICVVALSLAGRIRWGLFALLSLPMSLFLFGVVGQDGMTLAVTALGVALMSHALSRGSELSNRALAVIAVCFGLAALAKAPYAAFALILLAARADRRARLIAFLGVVAVAVLWHGWVETTVGTPFVAPGVALDAKAQLGGLLAAPWRIGSIAVATLDAYARVYYGQAVGVLGWIDTPLDPAMYRLAAPVLLAALALSAGFGRAQGWRAAPALALLAAFLATGLVFLAVYLTWTPVGAAIVEGVQGRYLLPVALVALLAFEGERPLAPARGVGVLAGLAVAALPVIGIIAAQSAIIARYYLD